LVEQLETRLVPAGSWAHLANVVPAGIGTMMLLTDGSVMAQQAASVNDVSNRWYKLTPGSDGQYATSGTWTTVASMNLPRRFYGSNVLKDGRVLVVGGGDSGSPATQNLTNTGEIYDPLANRWATIANFPQTQFGDDPTILLDNGQVLGGYIVGTQTYLYNPATNAWTQTGSRIHVAERGDEETWLKLPDGSVLSYDLWNDHDFGESTAERYLPSTGQWVSAGTVPVALTDSNMEMGGATMLPDGRAWFVGDNGNTAFYTPLTNTWTKGPTLPDGLIADDEPLCMLTNGHVLLALDGLAGVNQPPTHFCDFDPTVDFTKTSPFTPVAPPGLDTSNVKANQCRMLALPDGTALLAVTGNNQLFAYTPGSPPAPPGPRRSPASSAPAPPSPSAARSSTASRRGPGTATTPRWTANTPSSSTSTTAAAPTSPAPSTGPAPPSRPAAPCSPRTTRCRPASPTAPTGCRSSPTASPPSRSSTS
jgi:hypothetical protein